MKQLLPLVLSLILTAAAVHAHHSLSGVYDSAREVTIEGVVSEFRFINPHPFLIIEVKPAAAGAAPQTWKVEMDNRFELAGIGMTDDTFKRGDWVTVNGSPAHDAQTRAMYVRKLERPADGFEYRQIGDTPQIRRRPPRTRGPNSIP